MAIGASTGGPQALERIFTLLHADFPAPILIVQHMTPGFLRGFAAWLNGSGKTPVKIAEDGETLLPGVAYVAPDSKHLRLGARFRAQFGDDTPRGLFRPAVDVLFESVALNAGPTGVGLILTGMGSDGAAGLKRMREAGGMCLAQDPLSCVVPGMPSAAKTQGAVEHEVDLERISAVMETLFPRTH
jgi:two-component system chemotaxis response regulator CheB